MKLATLQTVFHSHSYFFLPTSHSSLSCHRQEKSEIKLQNSEEYYLAQKSLKSRTAGEGRLAGL